MYRILSYLLCCLSFATIANPIVLNQDTDAVKVTDQHIWQPIELGRFDAFSGIEKPDQVTVASLVGQRGSFAVKLAIEVESAGRWYVMPTANFIDTGLAFWQSASGHLEQIADFSQTGLSAQIQVAHGQAFYLSFQQPTSGYLWIIVKAEHFPTTADISILSESEFASKQYALNTFTVMTVSVMLALALMALLIFVRTKHKVALFCAGYVGLHSVGWMFAAGLIQSLSMVDELNTTYGGIYLFPFAIASAAYFAYRLFDFQNRDFIRAKLLPNFANISLVSGILIWFLPFYMGFYISHLLAGIWVALSIYIAVKQLSNEDFRAKYFFVGNFLYSASLVYLILSHAHVYNLPYPELVVLFALTLDCLCILLSLSEWLKIKQQEHKKVLTEARFDSLTSVGNRHLLNEELRRLGDYYLTVFIDCDGIKAINDELGHAEGDTFLTYVADLMNFQLGNLGQVFRSGGDEFIWVCQSQTEQELKTLEVKIGKILQNIDICVTQRWPQSGISYGTATSLESTTPSRCLSKADARMYENKSRRKASDTKSKTD